MLSRSKRRVRIAIDLSGRKVFEVEDDLETDIQNEVDKELRESAQNERDIPFHSSRHEERTPQQEESVGNEFYNTTLSGKAREVYNLLREI